MRQDWTPPELGEHPDSVLAAMALGSKHTVD